MFSFRDALGRDAVSGVWPSAQAPSPAVPVVATYDGASPLGGYSVNTPVPSDCKPLSVSYYDDHSFMDDLVPSDARRVLACDTLSNYGTPVVGSDRCKGLLTGTAVYSLADPMSKTVSSFYYDYQGRLIQSHRKEALGGDGHIHQSLTFTGKPSRTRETVALPDGRIDSLVTVRSYDGQERLVSETTSLNGRSQSVSYGYDEIGRMTGRIYGTEANPSALTETLSYNIRDQLTGLNSSVFSMTLRYQEPTLGSVPKYNGGISEWEWNHGAGAETNAWSLSYDGVGRLTDARRFVGGVQTNSFSERSITYDRNSNALTLTRYGENAATPEEILAYSYNGNLLSGISNTGASGGGGQYTHDANGNMTHEGLSGLDIVYNEQNLTRRISSGGTTLAEYEHLADGTKLRALDGGGNGYQYRGSLIYAQTAGQSDSPVITLDCALTSAGRIVRENTADGSLTYKVQHYLRDHLGSVRSVIDGDTGAVVETNDYYPFGKRIQVTAPVSEPVEGSQYASDPAVAPVVQAAPATSVVTTSSPNRWHFSGKESQSFLNASIPLLDFGARMYNPAIARWTAADPLSEKYYGISPYAYCLGNPIGHIDDDGQMPQVVVGALIGAAVGGIIAAAEGKNWREIGGAAVGGAVGGALVSATGGMSLLGSKAVATVLSAGAASAAGSTANQLIGEEGSVEAKQVAWDAGNGLVFGGFAKPTFNNVATNVGDRIATEAQQKYTSKAVRSSIEKEVKKEMRMSGINIGGKSGSRKVKLEVDDRLVTQRDFEFSIANAIRNTKVGDIANDVAAHKVSLLIYNKDE